MNNFPFRAFSQQDVGDEWGTARIAVSTQPRFYDKPTLIFWWSYSTERLRRYSCRKRSLQNSEHIKPLYNYKGFDLIKWQTRQVAQSQYRRRFVVKTRFIIMLQRKIRKFIIDRRRVKFA